MEFEKIYSIFGISVLMIIPLVIIPLYFYFIIIVFRRRKEKKEITTTIIPKNFVLEDIIIIKQFGLSASPKNNDKILRFGHNNKLKYKIIPVIRDLKTNELLMSLGNDFYGLYKAEWKTSIFSNKVDWVIKRNDNSQIQLGDNGVYYIKEYVNYNMRIDGNDIYLNEIKYRYMGNIENSKPLNEIGNCLLFNVKNENIIDNANKIKFFKGYIDFDNKQNSTFN